MTKSANQVCPELTEVTDDSFLAAGNAGRSARILGVSLWRRMVALWPYVLIAISLAGLAYKFLTSSR